mmetsp:Transcript_1963/g.4741  ORF Transcript_1963/g.4741 Transcript_1963/m.4741 type:complete len:379 (-) Transcript_1963:143-1279(-)
MDVPNTIDLLSLLVPLLEQAALDGLPTLGKDPLLNTCLRKLLLGDTVRVRPSRQLRNHVEHVHGISVFPIELQNTQLALHVHHSRHVVVPQELPESWHLHVRAAPVEKVPVVAKGIHPQVSAEHADARDPVLLPYVEDAHVGNDHRMHGVLELHKVAEDEVKDREEEACADGLNDLARSDQGMIADLNDIGRGEQKHKPDHHQTVEDRRPEVSEPHSLHFGPRCNNLLSEGAAGVFLQAQGPNRNSHFHEELLEVHVDDRLLLKELLPGGRLIIRGVGLHPSVLILVLGLHAGIGDHLLVLLPLPSLDEELLQKLQREWLGNREVRQRISLDKAEARRCSLANDLQVLRRHGHGHGVLRSHEREQQGPNVTDHLEECL